MAAAAAVKAIPMFAKWALGAGRAVAGAKGAHAVARGIRGTSKALPKIAEYAIPGLTPGASRGQIAGLLAADLAPEVMFAGLHAATLPEGTPMGTRIGAGVEDAAIGMGLSWLGQGAAEAGLRALARQRGARNLHRHTKGMKPGEFGPMPAPDFKPQPIEMDPTARYAIKAGIGSAAMLGGFSAIPRPFSNSAYEQAEQMLNQEAMARRQQEDAALYEAAQMNAMQQLFGGYYG